MSSFDDLKGAIHERWRHMPVVDICLLLLDFVARIPEDQAKLLTIPMLAQGVGKERVDQEFMSALTLLVGSNFEVLQPRAMYIEGEDEWEIEPEILSEANKSGILAHPETGEAMTDFADRLYPFFVPSLKFKEILRTGHG